MLEDSKITIDEFHGLYARGMDDNIPPGHFKVCNNAAFNTGQIGSRFGTSPTFNFSFRPVKLFLGVIDYDRFFLILDDLDRIHRDGGATLLTIPVYPGTPSRSTDFSALNLYNRIYISPNYGSHVDTTYHFLYVYNGTTFRLAGGVKPSTSLTCVDNAAAGVVSAGTHQFAVSFVTDTGFITPPSALTAYVAPGAKQVDISTIPLGPTECVGRRILLTKAGETELFFAPSTGIIADNTTTSITLNVADTDLVSSADYLNDIYERIPAGTQLVFYKGRLIIIGGMEVVLASNVDDPETVNTVTGFLAVPQDAHAIRPPVSGWVLRDALYISKFPGVYATQDSGDTNPSNWPVSPVDESIGCYPNGISSYTAEFAGRNTSDYDILLTQQGVFLFDGVFRRPPMTWKIEDFWTEVVQADVNNAEGINYNFWRFTISHDIVLKKLYINCATAIYNTVFTGQWVVLHGDYSKGWESHNIKWSIWEFPFYASVAIMALHPVDNKYALRITSFNDTKLWTLDDSVVLDDASDLTFELQTGLLDKERGSLSHYLGVKFRASGVATLALVLTDGTLTTGIGALPAIVALVINSTASKDYLRLTNFTSEKAMLQLITTGAIKISRIDVYNKPMFLQRPQL